MPFLDLWPFTILQRSHAHNRSSTVRPQHGRHRERPRAPSTCPIRGYDSDFERRARRHGNKMDPVTVLELCRTRASIFPKHFSTRRIATVYANLFFCGVITDVCVSGCVQTEHGGAKLRDTHCQSPRWRDKARYYWPCHRHRNTLKQICSTMCLQCNCLFFHALSRVTLLRALMFQFSKRSRRNGAKRVVPGCDEHRERTSAVFPEVTRAASRAQRQKKIGVSLCNSDVNQCNSILTRCHQDTRNITEAATHTAEQVDDAHSGDDFVKRHLR